MKVVFFICNFVADRQHGKFGFCVILYLKANVEANDAYENVVL